MWNNNEGYLQWLRDAYEHLKKSKYVYDRKCKRIFYNKPYWLQRFKLEIQIVESRVEVEKKMQLECNEVEIS